MTKKSPVYISVVRIIGSYLEVEIKHLEFGKSLVIVNGDVFRF